MRNLLALLICTCLLAPYASGQSHVQEHFVQLGEKLGHLGDQLRNRNNSNGNHNNGNHNNGAQLQQEFAAPVGQQSVPGIDRRGASNLARDAYPGRVLNIRREGDHWKVRMDESGTVFNVFVDAENGAVIRSPD